MLTISRSSSKGRIAVASPSSVCSRHTNPGAASARAVTGSHASTNPASSGSVSGATGRPMFSWASSTPPTLPALGPGVFEYRVGERLEDGAAEGGPEPGDGHQPP